MVLALLEKYCRLDCESTQSREKLILDQIFRPLYQETRSFTLFRAYKSISFKRYHYHLDRLSCPLIYTVHTMVSTYQEKLFYWTHIILYTYFDNDYADSSHYKLHGQSLQNYSQLLYSHSPRLDRKRWLNQ